jgi:bifunctional non-homologous end joining protein LigD
MSPFDLLHLGGRSTRALPYSPRRELLAELELAGPAWQAPSAFRDEAGAVLAATRERGLEGVVAKRLDAPMTGRSETSSPPAVMAGRK